ncbi:MAG TPA: amylo-alpha-1,6-glucosidase [Pirellulales bacterium]|jgi:predicted glycogen debranching enzyme
MPTPIDNQTEWLEADGLGGFAMGTTSGERSRRYHGLLTIATNPPSGRMVLVNGFEAWITTSAGRFAISTQRYSPDVIYPDGYTRIADFQTHPCPRWTFRLPDGVELIQELFVPHDAPACCLQWFIRGPGEATLELRPLFSGRDYHSLQHENGAFDFKLDRAAVEHIEVGLGGETFIWRPYHDVPEIIAITNGQYTHEPEWFRNFVYQFEQERGLDFNEDLASPGTWRWKLNDAVTSQNAVLIFTTGLSGFLSLREKAGSETTRLGEAKVQETQGPRSANELFKQLRTAEQARRSQFPSPLHRTADQYLVRRGAGKTIIAGYPWFTDWGRDTFISLRGLCLAIDRLDEALQILLAWATVVSEGMLPNRFPDAGDAPEYNSVDASLWYIVAVHELIAALARRGKPIGADDRRILEQAVLAIVEGYSRGTRFGIRMDVDGLLAAGAPGTQLTWMDAKVGDWVVTPRVGKPVEVQALWLNALWIAARIDRRWDRQFQQASVAFEKKFWNASLGCLFDVVDVDHRPGIVDTAIRPNQIFTVGGLPLALVHGDKARSIVEMVESSLLVPLGLRTLSPGSPGYASECTGPPEQRDGVYHQGTVWPWLMGPFVEAWVRTRGGTVAAKQQAQERFLPAFSAHLQAAGLGHISEITDADPPFTPRGCPFQAWSLGEFMRLQFDVLSR